MTYDRPAGAASHDFAAARQFEEQVGQWLGPYAIGNLDSPTRLDYWIPGIYLDVKEKRQRLTERWHLLDNVDEPDLFVIDELSIRKALEHYPAAYFVLRDLPGNRVFLASIVEMVCARRARCNRVSSSGHAKGKWIMCFTDFRLLADPSNELMPAMLADQVGIPWRRSELLSPNGCGEL